MKLIPLTQGKFAKVDDEDFERFGKFNWHASHAPEINSHYAQRRINGKTSFLHREIMGNPSGLKVDHINHDTLDCQRHNLRTCTNSQNMANRNGLSANNTSGVRGVDWDKRGRKWRARVMVNQKHVCLGSFSNIKDAEEAVKS